MATFKITVDDKSELGQHIEKFGSRERSREIYVLATIGLLMKQGNSPTVLSPKENKLGNDFSNDPVAILTKAKPGEVSAAKNVINQSGGVDFGDELLDL